MHAATRRQRLTNLFAFVRLSLALEPGERGYKDERTERLVADITSFLATSVKEEFVRRSGSVERLLRDLCQSHRPRLPELYDPEQVGSEFRQLEGQTDVWRFGITYGWLAQRFMTPAILLPFELPPHARVGLGIFSGRLALEEADLLRDACFLLVQARTSNQRFLEAVRSRRNSVSVDDRRRDLSDFTAMNLNVGTFARLGVLSSVAFVESFVNSVGHSEVNRRPRTPQETEYLRGRVKGRFTPLEAKLEVFPSLIRPDGRSPLKVRDPHQREEPFATFLATAKEVRDSSMHFAPGKEAIIRTPSDWILQVEQAVFGSVAVARAFWAATYEEEGFPRYLAELDVERLLAEAEKRMPEHAVDAR